jgi:hypothetical protein
MSPAMTVRHPDAGAGRLRRIALAGVLALTLFGVGVPAASASQQRIRTGGGEVTFVNGDGAADDVESLLALDKRRDGYGVRAYLMWSDRSGLHRASVTDPESAGEGDSTDVHVLDGTSVLLTMCYIDEGRIKRCSYSQGAVA